MYMKLEYGATCPEGYDLTTEEECQRAVSALGITGLISPWVGANPNIPRYCSVRESDPNPRMHFGGSNSGGIGRSDLAPLCYKASDAGLIF